MKLKAILTLAALCSQLTIIFSQANLWKDIPGTGHRNSNDERWATPKKYRLLELDFDNLVNAFRGSPLRSLDGAKGLEVTLPMPDGTFQDFMVFEAPLLSETLAQGFPNIKTYSGHGVADPNAVVYLDVTSKGFHGMILSPGKSIFIDPFFKENTSVYACYNKQGYHDENRAVHSCGTESNEVILPSERMTSEEGYRSTTVSLRTYRIAISASGEYSNFHGGTVAGALAAISTTLNRVRGIYETELAISFQLVGNNGDIIYTDIANDPYTSPPDVGVNIGEVQTNINNVIGAANYDIGHLFTLGNGGIATLGCVCNNSLKARGATGSDHPVGSPFEVDFVAHEMGHQFGANHTFNGSTGSCNTNRNANAAYEPGSGSTIMAYAGICGAQNVQLNSYAFFHRKSLDEINNYIVDGNGNTCPSITSSGNNTPSVNADPNGMNNKYIPANTPFELSATGSDPDGNSLTYCWEQFDLGNAGAPAANLPNGPIFKSYAPTTSQSRAFPKLSSILDGSNGNQGEFLPSVSRSLNFECTVRDNQSVGGGFAHGSITLNVDNSASSFAIANHNTSSVVQQGITINWNVGNTTSSPVSCTNVDILLSTDGGLSFTPLVTATPNDGAQTVTLPNSATGLARIKVKCSDNVFFDINNADLRIAPADAACAEATQNGGFELGYSGNHWSQYSSHNYALLGQFNQAHNGTWSAWLGGDLDETSQIWQQFAIPQNPHFAALEFWYRITNFECNADVFRIKVNGSIVKNVDLCTDEAASGWSRGIIDMMAYQNSSPTIMFELITNSTHNTSVFVDDVSVFVCEGGAFPLLPVELVGFQAKANGKDAALLTWQTAQETNNKGFEIEMKNVQGVFSKIGFIEGAGTTQGLQSYRFEVPGMEAGTHYFRLRQIDHDGHFTYSEIRQVVIGGAHQIAVFPNPAKDMVFFEITQAEQQFLKLEILQATGQVVAVVTEAGYGQGTFKIPFQTGAFSPGIYFYRLSANNFEETGRFVVEH